jgi:hypothetical protein
MIGIQPGEVRDLRVTPIEADVPAEAPEESISQEELYERIAQGNALAEAEDIAARKWRGQ